MKRSITNAFSATGPLITYGNENVPDYSQQEQAPISCLTKELFYLIMNGLRAKDLQAFGNTSKHFQKLTDNASLWEKLYWKMNEFGYEIESTDSFRKTFNKALCEKNIAALMAKVCFECDNFYAKKNVSKALEMVNQLRKRVNQNHPLCCNVFLKKSELLATTPVSQISLLQADVFADKVLKHKTASSSEKSQAKFLKAKNSFLGETEADLDIFIQMATMRNDPDLSLASKIDVEIYLRLMILNDWELKPTEDEEEDFWDNETLKFVSQVIASITKEEALNYLEKVPENEKASIDQRAWSAYYVALEYIKKKTVEKDNQAANILYNIINDLDVSEIIRMEAMTQLVALCLENRQSIISDKQAINYIKQVANCKNLEQLQTLNELHFAKFRYQYRTEEIDDEEAFILFETVDGSDFVDRHIQFEALLFQAIMWYEGRPKPPRILREMALEYLDFIITDGEDLPYSIVSKANLYTALIYYDSKENETLAYRTFEALAEDELVEEKDRETAKKYRDLMIEEGRAHKKYSYGFTFYIK